MRFIVNVGDWWGVFRTGDEYVEWSLRVPHHTVRVLALVQGGKP